MRVLGKVVSIDLYHKAGVLVDRKGHWFVFKQEDCKNGELPSLQQSVSFEPQQNDFINRALEIEVTSPNNFSKTGFLKFRQLVVYENL